MSHLVKNQCSRRLYLLTNTSCNLRCSYCYENKGNKVFDLEESFFSLSEILSQETPNGTFVRLHGGEPFLVFDKIKEFCERIWAQNFKEKFVFFFTTNGTLVHGAIQEWLLEHKDDIMLSLSIDGEKKSHDLNRSNSFDKIDLEFFAKKFPAVNANLTISPMTLDSLAENVMFLHKAGFEKVTTHLAEMQKWPANAKDIVYDQVKSLDAFYNDHSNLKKCSLFDVDLKKVLYREASIFPCSIGQKKAYDFESKKYYPCHLYFDSVIGREKSEDLLKVDMTKPENFVSAKCKKCSVQKLCRSCVVANYIQRGNPAERDMGLCQMHKSIYKAICEAEFKRITQDNHPNKTQEDQKNDLMVMMAIKEIYAFL